MAGGQRLANLPAPTKGTDATRQHTPAIDLSFFLPEFNPQSTRMMQYQKKMQKGQGKINGGVANDPVGDVGLLTFCNPALQWRFQLGTIFNVHFQI